MQFNTSANRDINVSFFKDNDIVHLCVSFILLPKVLPNIAIGKWQWKVHCQLSHFGHVLQQRKDGVELNK